MIYRIHPDIGNYGLVCFDGDQARESLGEDTDFHIDESPIAYEDSWNTMVVGFGDALGSKVKPVPDLSWNVGKLYLSPKACKVLKPIVSLHGELLPVTHDAGEGYLFNCLKVLSPVRELSVHSPLTGNFSIVFDEDSVSEVIFKSEIDFDALFCSEEFRAVVLDNHLTGLSFSEDLGNPYPEELGMRESH